MIDKLITKVWIILSSKPMSAGGTDLVWRGLGLGTHMYEEDRGHIELGPHGQDAFSREGQRSIHLRILGLNQQTIQLSYNGCSSFHKKTDHVHTLLSLKNKRNLWCDWLKYKLSYLREMLFSFSLYLNVPQLSELLCCGVVWAAHALPQLGWVGHIVVQVICYIHKS